MKTITNLNEGNFDNLYASNSTFGNIVDTNSTFGNIHFTNSYLTNENNYLLIENPSTVSNCSVLSLATSLVDPNFKLHVQKGTPTQTIDGDVLAQISLNYNNSLNNGSVRFHRGGNADDGYLSFASHNGLERMRVSNYVGIGTSTASYLLDVSGGARINEALTSTYFKTSSNFFSTSNQSNTNGITLTASIVKGNFVNRTSANAGQTDTLDTASNFVSSLGSINTGYVLSFYYFNNSSNSITLALGTGGQSIRGTSTLSANNIYKIDLIFVSTSSYYVVVS